MKHAAEHRIAIVGAGPAGVYASDILLKRHPGARVDIFEKLPAPYGLVRYGVAPDHPRIQKITGVLHRILENPRTRVLCNVDVGGAVSVERLRDAYDAVILATGADRDAPLDIPGAHLPGSFGGADFVAWYDGHPDVPTSWPLDATSVAVLGAGNVALDVTRMIAKHAEHLSHTDIPAHVETALHSNPVREVHLFVRRGPADVRFSPLELRELGAQPDVDIVVDPRDMELDEHATRMVAQFAQQKQIVEALTEFSRIEPSARTASRRVRIHFYQRPAQVLGEDRVTGIRMERTAPDPLGRISGTGEFISYPVQAVYRTIGYRSSAVPGVPFDELRSTIPERDGRVLGPDGQPLTGLYTTGWARRGAVGLIGSTRSDALQTLTSLLADLEGGRLPERPSDAAEHLRGTLQRAVEWEGWLRIDAAERELGQRRGRDRTKIVGREELLDRAH